MATIFLYTPANRPWVDAETDDTFGAGEIHIFDDQIPAELDQANRMLAEGAGLDVVKLIGALLTLPWSQVTGKPAVFTPGAHTHNASDIVSGVLDLLRVPDLPASKIAEGVLDSARIPDLDAGKIGSGLLAAERVPAGAVTQHAGALTLALSQTTGLVSALQSKIDAVEKGVANGLASLDESGTLPLDQIPGLPAAQITGGSLDLARVPALPSAQIDTGSGPFARGLIPQLDASQISEGVFDLGRIPALPASIIGSGVVAPARIGEASVTQHQSALAIGLTQITDRGAFAALDQLVDPAQLADSVISEAKLDDAAREKLNRTAKKNLEATRDPALTDDRDQGYGPDSTWINTTTDEAFKCVDASLSAARWIKTTLSADELGGLAFQAPNAVAITGGAVDVGALRQDGHPVWHEGNFSPSEYLLRAGDVMTGALSFTGPDRRIVFADAPGAEVFIKGDSARLALSAMAGFELCDGDTGAALTSIDLVTSVFAHDGDGAFLGALYAGGGAAALGGDGLTLYGTGGPYQIGLDVGRIRHVYNAAPGVTDTYITADPALMMTLDPSSPAEGVFDLAIAPAGAPGDPISWQSVLKASTQSFAFMGHEVWTADNFDPGLKLDASAYTPADVLAKIKTVDGAGSGLDAERLAGQSADSYLRSDADDTVTGLLTLARTNEVMNIFAPDPQDAWIRLGNESLFWRIRYVGSTVGTDGNELRFESGQSGRYWQFDHAGNFEHFDGVDLHPVWHGGNLDADSLARLDQLPFAAIAQYSSTDTTTDINQIAGVAIGWDYADRTDPAITVNGSEISVAEAGLYKVHVRLSFDTRADDGVIEHASPGVYFEVNGQARGALSAGGYLGNGGGQTESSTSLTEVIALSPGDTLTVKSKRMAAGDIVYLRAGESVLLIERVGGRSPLLPAQRTTDIIGLEPRLSGLETTQADHDQRLTAQAQAIDAKADLHHTHIAALDPDQRFDAIPAGVHAVEMNSIDGVDGARWPLEYAAGLSVVVSDIRQFQLSVDNTTLAFRRGHPGNTGGQGVGMSPWVHVWTDRTFNPEDKADKSQSYTRAEIDQAILDSQTQVKSDLIGGAPNNLDTFLEVAQQLTDQGDAVAVLTDQIAQKQSAANAVTTDTDQTVTGVKTFEDLRLADVVTSGARIHESPLWATLKVSDDIYAFRTPVDVQYFDGLTWRAWAEGVEFVRTLLDGSTTPATLPVDRSRFRFVIQTNDWTLGQSFLFRREWSASRTAPRIRIESAPLQDFSADVALIREIQIASPDDYYVKFDADHHSANLWHRIEFDFGDPPVPQTLNGFSCYSLYARGQARASAGTPFRWHKDQIDTPIPSMRLNGVRVLTAADQGPSLDDVRAEIEEAALLKSLGLSIEDLI